MQVAKSINIVTTNRAAAIVIKLDMDMIRDTQLSIDAKVVQESIRKTIKLKQEVRIFLTNNFNSCRLHISKSSILQHIKVLDAWKLEILPQEADRSKIHFNLHYLKTMLPTVMVKVSLLELKIFSLLKTMLQLL